MAATEDDGCCIYGDGPAAMFTVMDAACFDGTGSLTLDSATVAIAGAMFSVNGTAIENGMMELALATTRLCLSTPMVAPTKPRSP